MLNSEEIERNREEFLKRLRDTGRKGIDNVINYLENYDFFNLPSSDRNHHNWRGGLAQHQLEVMRYALNSYPNLPPDSVILASLLHDICKTDQFKISSDGKISRTLSLKKGHGSKSLQILHELGLEMTPEEERAIRYHMKSMRAKTDDTPGLLAARKDSLWWAIRKADALSARKAPKM